MSRWTAVVCAGVSVALSVCSSVVAAQGASEWVFYGADGKLQYKTLPGGDRIMDFSHAGYGGGGVALPRPPAAVTLTPSGVDDSAQIQGAIDQVSALPLVAGVRGAVVLNAGRYTVSRTLKILASGVSLRGAGSGPDGTVVTMAGGPFRFLQMLGSGSPATSDIASIIDTYVPSGARTVTVDSAAAFRVGDEVFVRRPVTEAWVHLMGMDTLMRNGQPQTWIAPGTWIDTPRRIAAVDGNQITLDVPLSDSIDSVYLAPPGGKVQKYSWPTRIREVGVEGLRILAPAPSADPNASKFSLLQTSAVVDAWMKDVYMKEGGGPHDLDHFRGPNLCAGGSAKVA